MQKITIEFTGLEPSARDRLIRLLRSFVAGEKEPVFLEIRGGGPRGVVLPAGGGQTLRIIPEDILYVTSDGHYCIFHLRQGSRRIRIPFSTVLSLLSDEEFLDCNRGVLLALRHIRCADKEGFTMTDGAVFVPRSKRRREALQRYAQYHPVTGFFPE